MRASLRQEWRPASWLVLALVALMAALEVSPAQMAEPLSAPDLVWVTEDRWYESNKPGCDAASVHSVASGQVVAAGDTNASPGRMALAPDLSLAIATHTNHWRRLHFLYRIGDDLRHWRSGALLSPAGPTTFGGVAFSSDSRFLLLATSNGYERDPLGGPQLQNLPPHYVRKYRRPASLSDGARLAGDVGSFVTRGAAAEILVGPDGSSAHVLTDESVVHSLDIRSMQETAPSVMVSGIVSPPCRQFPSPLPYMQAALSTDGRYLAANRGMVPELAVADLAQRTAITVPVAADVGFVGGLAVNRGALNHGLIAVHAETSVLLYEWQPPSGLTELAREPIRSEKIWDPLACTHGPHLSIAWSGNGQYLIASQDVGGSEFVVLRVTQRGDSYEISREHDLAACQGNPNFPNDVVTVNGFLGPPPTPAPSETSTPTATLTPPTRTVTPSATFRPSTSATPRATPTATATASSTATRYVAYLPVTIRERCDPDHKRADVALVIDTSSSMTGQKLEHAKSAAVLFVGLMDLAPGRDQVAVVRYDREAEVVCELSRARAVIEAAIRGLAPRNWTHIDAGLRTALAELQSPRHLERNMSVMILLTDGVQTGAPGEELRAAAEVRGAGVRLYAIGLGGDVDAVALREMAGDGSRYHFAPDSADLARIYAEIARDITCPAPAGGFWPGP